MRLFQLSISVRISIMSITAVSGVWDLIKCIALKQGNRVSNSPASGAYPDNQNSLAAPNWGLINCKKWQNVIFSFLGKDFICVHVWVHRASSRWGKGGQPELFHSPGAGGRGRRITVDHLLWSTPYHLVGESAGSAKAPMQWSWCLSTLTHTAVDWAARQVANKRDYEEM